MKPLVSVIVPVYKVEPYLERCLDSLVSQTLKEIEIIVIDDGSPDRCGEICDAYAAKDVRFRVVHQENAGVSAARNVGIELARADYLMFVDPDDWVDPEYCRLPYQTALEHSADLVLFPYLRHVNGRNTIHTPDDLEGVKSRDEAVKLLFHGIGVGPTNKCYHRNLFSTLRFPEGRLYEDNAVTHWAVYSAETVFFLRRPLYYYYRRKGSTTQALTHRAVEDRYELVSGQCTDLENWGYAEEAEKRRLLLCYWYLLSEGFNGKNSRECLSYYKEHYVIINSVSWRGKGMLCLLRYVPFLFDWISGRVGRRVK